MSCRLSPPALTLVLLVTPSLAKEKKKPILPAEVLQARTARVIIYPDAGEPIIRPRANETARTNVEKALMEWGRFEIVPDGQESDLVFVVRTGNGTFAQERLPAPMHLLPNRH